MQRPHSPWWAPLASMMLFPRFWPAVFSLSHSVWDTSSIHGLGPLLQLNPALQKLWFTKLQKYTFLFLNFMSQSISPGRVTGKYPKFLLPDHLYSTSIKSYWFYPLSTTHPIYACLKTEFLEFSSGWLSLLRVYLYLQCPHCRVTWNLKCSGINLLLKTYISLISVAPIPAPNILIIAKYLVFTEQILLSFASVYLHILFILLQIYFSFSSSLPSTTSCGEFLFAFYIEAMVPGALPNSVIQSSLQGWYSYCHFTDKKNEVKGAKHLPTWQSR